MSTLNKKRGSKTDPYKGPAPVDEKKILTYKRGKKLKSSVKSKYHNKLIRKAEKVNNYTVRQAARSEILLPEDAGFIEPDEDENTYDYLQEEIASAVDISSAAKYFDLNLKFGPYSMDFSRNGRHLLIGGKKGHVAAFDWVSKKLLCEINVMESVHNVKWMHTHNMFSVAQKDHLYMYDNQGLELHCIKKLYRIINMEFLPYHFLLSTASDNGYLSWLDISIGKMVNQYNSKMGRLNIMCQNPYNAVVLTGHSNGTVSMWSPNSRDPLVKMLCHKRPLGAIQVDSTGKYMATASCDGQMFIWDVRTYKQLHSYKFQNGVSGLSFSQRGLLSVSIGNTIEIFKDCFHNTIDKPYLRFRAPSTVTGMKFCPYEDVLGISHSYGYSSILTPGSGEPNFDAFESNPFQTKSQRREMEVKALLEKIQPELICLDPGKLGEVDVGAYKAKLATKKSLLHVKPPKVDVELKNKKRSKSGSGKEFKRKSIIRNKAKLDYVKEKQKKKSMENSKKEKKPQYVLDRFKKKE